MFSAVDMRDYVAPRESRWIATYESGRAIHFGLGPSADQAFALRYAKGKLVTVMSAWADGAVTAVQKEG